MSKKIGREGTFVGYAMQSGVGKTKANGFSQWIAGFQAVQEYDFESQAFIDITAVEEVEITGYFVLFDKDKKPLLNAKQIKKAYPDLQMCIRTLNNEDLSAIPVQFRVEESEYKGKKSMQVTWIDHIDAVPGGQVQKLDQADEDAMEAEFASAFRELEGGDKPLSVPSSPAKVARPTTATKPVVPKATTPPPAATPPAEAAEEPTNKELMKDMAKATVEDQKERAAEAEYKALSPKDKKAFNKKKRDEATAKKAAVNVPRKATPPPPVAAEPPVEEAAASSTQELIDALDLAASCTQDEAWEACEANACEAAKDLIADAWKKVVMELGGDVKVEAGKAWPEVRSRVLTEVIAV